MSLATVIQSVYLRTSLIAFRLYVFVLNRRGRKISLGKGAQYFGRPILLLKRNSLLKIGNKHTLRSGLKSNALGVRHPVIFCTLKEGALLEIGNGVGISGGTFCSATSIKIGDSVLIGANTTIVDTDFHPIDPVWRLADNSDAVHSAPITIGNNVFIGTGCIILKGVTIGDNSVIGAGSVVTKSIPNDVIAAGNPCTVVKSLTASPSKCVR